VVGFDAALLPSGPVLIVFAGLPGVGKTSIARALAGQIGATYLRIDTIEQALRSCDALPPVGPEGYVIAYRVAAENLTLGRIVVADAVNGIELTRRAWRQVAEMAGALLREVEVICSDAREHRRRIEERATDVAGLRLPRWDEVERYEYEPWTRSRLVLDTAGQTPEACLDTIVASLVAAR
jgi:predicted kinase